MKDFINQKAEVFTPIAFKKSVRSNIMKMDEVAVRFDRTKQQSCKCGITFNIPFSKTLKKEGMRSMQIQRGNSGSILLVFYRGPSKGLPLRKTGSADSNLVCDNVEMGRFLYDIYGLEGVRNVLKISMRKYYGLGDYEVLLIKPRY